ncbi:MAG: hypothetical protein Q9228_005108 [Teloschistes exilis]
MSVSSSYPQLPIVVQYLLLGDAVTTHPYQTQSQLPIVSGSRIDRNTMSERSLHRQLFKPPSNMRRFGVDQFGANFSPQPATVQRTGYLPPPRALYSHIQIVPKVESSSQKENYHSPQETFSKPSYTEEAQARMAVVEAIGPSQPVPTATLANKTSGTTFAQKARAAELNAALARRAAKENAENAETPVDPPMTSTSLGALKLNKPRNNGKNWKKLNLDEIPETPETTQPENHLASTTRNNSLSGSDLNRQFVFPNLTQSPHPGYQQVQQVLPNTDSQSGAIPFYTQNYQALSAIPQSQFTNTLLAPDASQNSEQFGRQMMHFNQMNQMAAQRNAQYLHSPAPTRPAEYQSATTQSPEQIRRHSTTTADDPFVDMPRNALRHNFPSTERHSHQSFNTPSDSGFKAPSAVSGSTNFDRKFSAERQQPRTIQPPPGLSTHGAYFSAASGGQHMLPSRPSAPAPDIYQRDPKPYTSFARSTQDISKNKELLQHLQQVVDVPKAESNTSVSNRTVLYDAVARDISETSGVQAPVGSRTGSDILRTSEPLPWKNRPVDIYNMAPSASTATQFNGHEQGLAATSRNGGFQGNPFLRQSLIPKKQTVQERLDETEAWWRGDGGRQEAVRAYLERVAEEHRQQKMGRDYESIKKELERQASFRDEWPETCPNTPVPEASTAGGDIVRDLLIPVLANLQSYVNEPPSYFNKFSKVPAWAIDNGPDGNKSFFGEDWGKPPTRVGRDPRYRPTFHEGRYTVFEPNDGGRVNGRGWQA